MATGRDDEPSIGSDGIEGSDASISRRRFLAVQSLAVAGMATAGCQSNGPDTNAPGTPRSTTSEPEHRGVRGSTTDESRDSGPAENTVVIDLSDRTEGPVSDQHFGRLCEHYCSGTIYPGVYSQHVGNPSFYADPVEDYFGPKTFFDPATIDRHDQIPFPWEPVGDAGVSFDRREGGAAAVETTSYQRFDLDDARGGIAQKIVLPDFRTSGFDLAFSVRGDGVEALTASIATGDGDVLASAEVGVSGEWERREVELELDGARGDRFVAGAVANVDTPYGEYVLELAAEGSGRVDLDWITLAAADAVNGKFNPSTVELMRERNATWLKWPGGNFTSQYNWRDGIGPLSERPSRFNHAWGGVEPNYFGTAEYLELCEVADLTPRITVGWWDNPPEWASERRIRPEDAADWVEYCNGSTDTEMGALRAEHGHPESYDVTHWEVGNEVYGPWQRGHTADPAEYASGSDEREGFNAFYDAMTAVDDSITVLADGMDPMYQEANIPVDPVDWNETLFEESGDRLDGLDVHRYNWGIENQADRDSWYEENDAGPIDYNEVLVMFPTQFGELMEELSATAEEFGLEDFRINVGEYGLFPSVDDGAPYPGPETMAGGAYIAGMLNAFVRQSETVREASQTWVPVRMFPPEWTDFPPDPNPQAPAGAVFGLYSAPFEGDTEWDAVAVSVSGSGRTIPETGPRIRRTEDVPYVDATAMRSVSGDRLVAFATNRNLRERSSVTLELGDPFAGARATVTMLAAPGGNVHAFQDSWDEPDAYERSESDVSVDGDGTIDLELDPAAVVRLTIGGE